MWSLGLGSSTLKPNLCITTDLMLFSKSLLSDFRRKLVSSVLTLNMRFTLDWSSRVKKR